MEWTVLFCLLLTSCVSTQAEPVASSRQENRPQYPDPAAVLSSGQPHRVGALLLLKDYMTQGDTLLKDRLKESYSNLKEQLQEGDSALKEQIMEGVAQVKDQCKEGDERLKEELNEGVTWLKDKLAKGQTRLKEELAEHEANAKRDLATLRDAFNKLIDSNEQQSRPSSAVLDELRRQMCGIQEELKSTKLQLHNTQTELKTNQDALQSTQDSLQSTQDSLQSTQTDLQTTKESLQSTQDSLNSTQEILQSTQDSHNSTQEILQSTQDSLQSTQTDLQTTKDSLQSTQDSLQSTQTDLQTTKDSLQSTQDYLQSTQTDLQTTKDSLQSTQDSLQSTQTDLQTTKDSLQSTQADLQEKVKAAEEALQMTQHQLQNEVHTAQEEVRSLHVKVHGLESSHQHYGLLQSLEMEDRNFTVIGSTFTRWGRTSCPVNTSLVYSGVAGGTHFSHTGGASNYLCLVMDPQLDNMTLPSTYNFLYGSEYENIQGHHDQDVVCSVCRAPQGTTLMIPATLTCPAGWTTQYSGHLVSDRHGHKGRTEYVCLDEIREHHEGGHPDQNGAMFYHVVTRCGSLPCPPYVNMKVVTCVVCSM